MLERDIEIQIPRILEALDIAVTVIDTDTFVFGAFSFNHFTVIAVRGTMPVLSDWITDLDARKVKLNTLATTMAFIATPRTHCHSSSWRLQQTTTRFTSRDIRSVERSPVFFRKCGRALDGR
jgi:hypothetical protein